MAKALDATNTDIDDFVRLIGNAHPPVEPKAVPLIGFAEAGAGGYFDDGGFPGRPRLGRDRLSGGR